MAIKKPKKKEKKYSKSLSLSQERPRRNRAALLADPDSARCKTCTRHDRNFRMLSPQQRQEKLKTYNAQHLQEQLNKTFIQVTDQRPYKVEHVEEATEVLQMSMMNQNKKIRDMHLKNEELSQKVSRLQRKLSQSLTKSKIMADETVNQ